MLTVIVASYRYGHLAAHCIESLLSQTKAPDKILFVKLATSFLKICIFDKKREKGQDLRSTECKINTTTVVV